MSSDNELIHKIEEELRKPPDERNKDLLNFWKSCLSATAGKADKSKVGLFSFTEIFLYTSCVLISALILGLSLNFALTKVLDVLRGINQALANIPIKFENTLNKITNTC